MSQDQLDLFHDSRDVMLRNDVCEALQTRDPATSRSTLLRLENEYPNDPAREAFEVLVGVPAVRNSAIPGTNSRSTPTRGGACASLPRPC